MEDKQRRKSHNNEKSLVFLTEGCFALLKGYGVSPKSEESWDSTPKILNWFDLTHKFWQENKHIDLSILGTCISKEMIIQVFF